MSTLTDEELMDRFCQGDPGAFERLFERHAGRVHAFVHQMVREPALSDDLLQTTFLSVVRSRDRYERGTSVLTWILSIAGNAARDALRRRQTISQALARSKLESTGRSESVHTDPGLRRRLEAAFEALPEQQREAVLLHKVQGLSFDEIARALEISVTAARIRAHRGYEKLRVSLADLEER